MVVSGLALAVTADGGDYVEQEVQAIRRASASMPTPVCRRRSGESNEDSAIERLRNIDARVPRPEGVLRAFVMRLPI